jgi:hypothetical protein
MSLPEEHRSQPHERGSFRYGGLVIAGHAHRQLRQLEPLPLEMIAQYSKPAKDFSLNPLITRERRHRHESLQL